MVVTGAACHDVFDAALGQRLIKGFLFLMVAVINNAFALRLLDRFHRIQRRFARQPD